MSSLVAMARWAFWLAFALVIIVVAIACARPAVDREPVGPDVVDLQLGQSVEVARHRLELTFDAVLADSLCPSEVPCIEAGSAVIAVTMRRGSLDGQVTLVLQPGETEVSPRVRVEHLSFRLVSLTKEPVATLEVGLAD